MKTVTVVSLTFSDDIYAHYKNLGRLITGVISAKGLKEVSLPFGSDDTPTVIPQKAEDSIETFRLKHFTTESLSPDTIDIYFNGIIREELSTELIKRAKQTLTSLELKDIQLVAASIEVSFTLVEKFLLEV